MSTAQIGGASEQRSASFTAPSTRSSRDCRTSRVVRSPVHNERQFASGIVAAQVCHTLFNHEPPRLLARPRVAESGSRVFARGSRPLSGDRAAHQGWIAQAEGRPQRIRGIGHQCGRIARDTPVATCSAATRQFHGPPRQNSLQMGIWLMPTNQKHR